MQLSRCYRVAAVASLLLFSSQGFASETGTVATPSGAMLKVVVRHDAAVYESPDYTSRNRPVRMFSFFYVLKPGDDAEGVMRDDFYRVATGPSAQDEAGWIHKTDVVEWPHRQALQLRPADGRQRALFYKDRTDLNGAYDGAEVDPLSREPESGAGLNLVPILDTFKMNVDGDDVAGYQVAYLHSRNAAAGREPEEAGGLDLQQATLDVVFVVDTTRSMQPFIEATKQVVARIAKQVAEADADLKPAIRFGLVGYRDVITDAPEDWYVTRLFCDLEQGADPDFFQKQVEGVVEASVSSEDVPEDVLAGIKLAVRRSNWNPHAFKHIVLIGDASAHVDPTEVKNSQSLTVPGAIALAQPRGRENVREKIVIHALRIVSEYEEDHELSKDHFAELARGDSLTGAYDEFDGKTAASAFVESLVATLLSAQEGLDAARQGQTPRRDTPGLGLLLEMVNASEDIADGDAPHFASGFTCEVDGEGNQLFEPHVLVQRGRMSLFNSALDFSINALRQAGEPGSRDVQRVVQSMQVLATQINLGEPIDPNMPLAKLLSAVLGFPVRNDIFDMTFSKLTAMGETDFQSWVRQVEASRSIIQSHLDNPAIWRSLGDQVDLDKRYGFLRVKDLP